jgi:hypothetical protein
MLAIALGGVSLKSIKNYYCLEFCEFFNKVIFKTQKIIVSIYFGAGIWRSKKILNFKWM